MNSLLRPSPEAVRALVEAQRSAPFSYDLVGHTRGALPPGWAHEEAHVAVGRGEGAFLAASAALRRWVQFDLDWVYPVSFEVPIEPGALFGFLSRQLGVWSFNACRVAYVIDEPDAPVARFGFAYGTVGTHGVRGEEQFLVAWDRAGGEVRLSIRKFSRPAGLLRLVAPIARRVQARFTREALARFAAELRS